MRLLRAAAAAVIQLRDELLPDVDLQGRHARRAALRIRRVERASVLETPRRGARGAPGRKPRDREVVVTNMSGPTEDLTARLKAAPEYVLVLPFFVEVTLANAPEAREYYTPAPSHPSDPPFPVEFTFMTGEQ